MSSLRLRAKRLNLRVSVIVPCAEKHAGLLAGVVQNFAQQTIRPDEVVLAVSGSQPLSSSILKTAPSLRVIPSVQKTPAYAGANRNRGMSIASGDLLIFQDADDISHPKRIEIIRRLFERYEIDHLMHEFCRDDLRNHVVDLRLAVQKAKYRPIYIKDSRLTNGSIAIMRRVAKRFRFDEKMRRGQDSAYNQNVYPHFRSTTAVLRLPLIEYRQHLSTLKR